MTQQSLVLAQSDGLGQVTYDLQAQLGRIELAMGDRQRAIAAYRASVATLQTLVFMLDDRLRSIPMSVLHDGEQYLIEKYAIAATPGLRLVNPEPLP